MCLKDFSWSVYHASHSSTQNRRKHMTFRLLKYSKPVHVGIWKPAFLVLYPQFSGKVDYWNLVIHCCVPGMNANQWLCLFSFDFRTLELCLWRISEKPRDIGCMFSSCLLFIFPPKCYFWIVTIFSHCSGGPGLVEKKKKGKLCYHFILAYYHTLSNKLRKNSNIHILYPFSNILSEILIFWK